MPKNPYIRVKMEGYRDRNLGLREERLAKLMKVTSRAAPFPGVSVTKRGGSTTAEGAEMGVYSILLPTIDREACNGDYLIQHGLGENIDRQDFVGQISKAVKWKGDPNTVYHPPFDWRTNLLEAVTEKIRISVKAQLGVHKFSDKNVL